MNKAILWDLDGTLLYTLQDLTNATNATLRAFGLAERKFSGDHGLLPGILSPAL